MTERLKIEYVPLTEIKPYANNAKQHPPEQIEQIMASMREFGNIDPIGVWRGEIVEGHGRYMAAQKLGYDTVPIIRLDDLTDEQRKAYALAHNKLTMNSGFDIDLLNMELAEITDIDMSEFGFALDGGDEGKAWFERENRDFDAAQEGNEEYNAFVDKFALKKTTDDCYTPPLVYEAVADWVCAEYGVDKKDFVRPFYPGGDYQAYKYKPSAIVVDNPPFSILAEIIKWYTDAGIKFFLFAPTLTIFSSSSSSCTVVVDVTVTYENGAKVNTSFVTNLEAARFRSAPTLYEAVKAANDANVNVPQKERHMHDYPEHVIVATKLAYYSKYGVEYSATVEATHRISELDEQKEQGLSIFGSGYLLSERAAAERAAAERAAAERAAAERAAAERKWELSEREWEIVRGLK